MIIVCSLKDLESVCESVEPSHVISVIDPGYVPETPKGVKYHLKLGFDDIENLDSDHRIFRSNTDKIPPQLPNENHIKSIADFSASWNPISPIVIHCWCGVSRSMATATFFLCKHDSADINKNIRYIRSVAPHANPNKLIIKLFEKNLQIENEISQAFLKYPHTKSYDCSVNFAPVTIFDYDDMSNFK